MDPLKALVEVYRVCSFIWLFIGKISKITGTNLNVVHKFVKYKRTFLKISKGMPFMGAILDVAIFELQGVNICGLCCPFCINR